MNVLVPTISQHVIINTLTTISSSLMSTQSIYHFLITCKHVSNHQDFQKQMVKMDLSFKLKVTTDLIHSVIKHYHTSDICVEEMEQILNGEKFTISIPEKMPEYNIIDFIKYPSLSHTIPSVLRTVIYGVLEIVGKINEVLQTTQNIVNHYINSYYKLVYSLNIQKNIDEIIQLTDIFDLRLNIFTKTLQCSNVLK